MTDLLIVVVVAVVVAVFVIGGLWLLYRFEAIYKALYRKKHGHNPTRIPWWVFTSGNGGFSAPGGGGGGGSGGGAGGGG